MTTSFPEAIVLGIVQGLAEFLPISSKGHLALGQAILGVTEGGLSFIVLLHLGTLLAVVLAYPARARQLALGSLRLPFALFRPFARWTADEQLAGKVALSTIPAGLAGLFFRDAVAGAFARPELVGCGLLATAALLWTTRRAGDGTRDVTVREAVLIGLAQSLAILPGVSRSGTTIGAALLLGVRRQQGAEFSFLSSIPLVVAAGALELPHLLDGSGPGWPVMLTGLAASAIFGYLAIVWLVRLVRAGAFYRFAPYCAAVGLIAIGWTLLR